MNGKKVLTLALLSVALFVGGSLVWHLLGGRVTQARAESGVVTPAAGSIKAVVSPPASLAPEAVGSPEEREQGWIDSNLPHEGNLVILMASARHPPDTEVYERKIAFNIVATAEDTWRVETVSRTTGSVLDELTNESRTVVTGTKRVCEVKLKTLNPAQFVILKQELSDGEISGKAGTTGTAYDVTLVGPHRDAVLCDESNLEANGTEDESKTHLFILTFQTSEGAAKARQTILDHLSQIQKTAGDAS